ncbi:hypothetical protein E3Q06_03962 [Wallemia mellicola]|uniref:Uncharacterized protein n=1 Tax=Wallemia mellicola TaxID=1708541 RepID=A0AB38MPC6_9BASI|nr:hypothetical protein E3Q24_03884 [Wallemia mellicola]TIB80001.1 hypothetical protein E3Q21_03950 [Wallemia mellicola]TIB83975.1 hypothetical protein E3Q20_03917 [Wallemia mellicola]TIC20172.1 hypothetical protein E3Q12_03960 [Wallemia mellicola]TIC30467.1 hypothetical protein E3Q09_04291 [Wallemia mellicola]
MNYKTRLLILAICFIAFISALARRSDERQTGEQILFSGSKKELDAYLEDCKKNYLKIAYQDQEKASDKEVVISITSSNVTSQKLDDSPTYKTWKENRKSTNVSEDETFLEFESKVLNCRLCLKASEQHNFTSDFKGLAVEMLKYLDNWTRRLLLPSKIRIVQAENAEQNVCAYREKCMDVINQVVSSFNETQIALLEHIKILERRNDLLEQFMSTTNTVG